MGSAERLACPRRRREGSVGTYVVPAYRSPFGSPASLMRHRVAEVGIAARPGVGTGVGNAVKHHGCAAATRRRRTDCPVEPRWPFATRPIRPSRSRAAGRRRGPAPARASRLVVLAGDGRVRRVLDLCELDGRLAVVTDHPSPAAQRVAVIDTGPMTPPPPKLVPGAG